VRHLECERDEAFLTTMEAFIKSVVGNSYNISMRQVLFRKKSFDGKGTSGIEERGFFCSELIAKAFKECGLLVSEQASCQFMPSDFSKEGDKLKLRGEARLGDELMIMFDEDDIKAKRAQLKREEAELHKKEAEERFRQPEQQ